ncbi:MAG: DHHA1 domain-containing protein [Pyrinomonadaceae bacterium]|nr:DHHA1 domain-containing protein [Pyrinomonadaceae bacterium]
MSVYETFDEQKQFACRVIADHARTTAFSIADGILPGNEGRAYVLRKIMRRAIYHGREHLGFHEAFFYKVCDFVVDQMKDAYPELEIQREFIGKMVRLEEERFGATMTVGLQKLEELVSKNSRINFKDLARLYDTYGTPIDLIFVVLNTRFPEDGQKYWAFVKEFGDSSDEFHEVQFFKFGNSVEIEYGENGAIGNDLEDLIEQEPVEHREIITGIDEVKFREIFEDELKQLQKTSDIGKTKQKENIKPIYTAMERTSVRSNFHGYERTDYENSKVVALVKDDQQVSELNEGEEGLIVLDGTPFYAESGGQVGDSGTVISYQSTVSSKQTDQAAKAIVFDTFAPIAGIVLHKSKVEKGSIKVGDTVSATVDVEKRDAIRRNHTATHLVHAALREVLGTHVKQAGSVVAPNYLRFDFAHYQPISGEEIKEIEIIVNREILKNEAVNTNIMAFDDAKNSGAMALFGEKYGSEVRVLSIGDGVFSKELCGGTHVRATGDIGSFKITADEAVASGVRRIRAITGLDAFERFRADEDLIEKSLEALRTQRDNLPSAIEKLQDELKKTRRENDELKMKMATGAFGQSANDGNEAKEIRGVKVLAQEVENLDANAVRQLSDNLLNRIKSGVVVIGRRDGEKVSLIVRVSDDLTDRIKAGNVIKEIAPVIGGRGGGKADMAEGGGNLPAKLSEAIEASYSAIEKMLS